MGRPTNPALGITDRTTYTGAAETFRRARTRQIAPQASARIAALTAATVKKPFSVSGVHFFCVVDRIIAGQAACSTTLLIPLITGSVSTFLFCKNQPTPVMINSMRIWLVTVMMFIHEILF